MAGESVPEVGDKASWTWNGSHPSGEVAEKKTDGDLAIKSSRGNTIKAPGSPSDPAVHLARPGNDVVKKQSDLDVESKGDGQPSEKAIEKAEKSKADEDPELHLNGGKAEEPKTGDKRKATEEPPTTAAADDGDGGEGEAGAAEQPAAKKARGRPKGNSTASAPAAKKKAGRKAAAPKKAKAPKPAKEKKAPATSTATGEGGAEGEKKGRGRPKKDGSASTPKAPRPKKDLKTKAQPVKGSMGTRTRSRA